MSLKHCCPEDLLYLWAPMTLSPSPIWSWVTSSLNVCLGVCVPTGWEVPWRKGLWLIYLDTRRSCTQGTAAEWVNGWIHACCSSPESHLEKLAHPSRKFSLTLWSSPSSQDTGTSLSLELIWGFSVAGSQRHLKYRALTVSCSLYVAGLQFVCLVLPLQQLVPTW